MEPVWREKAYALYNFLLSQSTFRPSHCTFGLILRLTHPKIIFISTHPQMFAVESVTRPFLFGWRRSSLPPFSPIQLPIERVEEVNDEKSPANSASAKSPALLSPTQYHRPPVWQTANPHVLYRCLLTLLGFAGAVVLLGGVGFIVSNLLVQQSYDHNDVQARVEHGLLQLQKKRGSRSSWAHRVDVFRFENPNCVSFQPKYSHRSPKSGNLGQ